METVDQTISGDDDVSVHVSSSNEQEVIGMLLAQQTPDQEEGALQIEQAMVETDEHDALPVGTITTACSVTDTGGIHFGDSQNLQAVQFSDGSTAIIQQKDLVDGQAVQLEDGSTVYIQQVTEKTQRFKDGQAVQLEDGSTAYILRAQPKGQNLQAIQLEDGTTAFIQTQMTSEAFTDQSQESYGDDQSSVVPADLAVLDQFTTEEIEGSTSSQSHTASLVKVGNSEAVLADLKSINLVHSTGVISKSAAIISNTSAKGYRCMYNECGRMYTTAHHLKVHERSHSGEKPYKCLVHGCSKAFTSGYGLKSHTRVHTGEKPYRCPQDLCTRAFKTSGDLQKHVRTHTGERPFKCPFEGCEKSFTTSNIRKVHIRTHTGERPYICDDPMCGRAFASATNYKNHMRIHTGEKPYVCTVAGCGKRFTEYSSLYKHHVVHTHSKPYICNHCGKNYRQTSTLAMHKRTAHGDMDDGDDENQGQYFTAQTVDRSVLMEPSAKRVQYEISTISSCEGTTHHNDNIVVYASGAGLLQTTTSTLQSQISDIVDTSNQVGMVTSVDPDVAVAAIQHVKASAGEADLEEEDITDERRCQLQDGIVAVDVQETDEGVRITNVTASIDSDTALSLEA